MAVNEQGAAIVGMAAAAASMPWAAKWAVGAFMDRYTYLPMGRRRPWLIGSQILIATAFVTFAIIAPAPDETRLVIGFCFLVSSLTAIQDVALDALVIDLTPDHEKGRLNGFMFAGKLFGIAGGVAIAGYFMQYHGISEAMLAMLVLFTLPATASIAIRERPGEKLLPWTPGVVSEAARAIKPEAWLPIITEAARNMVRRNTFLVILLLVLYGIHQALWEQGSNLYAAEILGWGESDLGNLGAITNLIYGAFCLLVGGTVIDRFGPKPVALLSCVVSLVLLGWFASLTPNLTSGPLYVAFSLGIGLPTTLFYLSFLVLAMRVSVVQIAATSFALIVATHAVGITAGGSLLGTFNDQGGFPLMFGASAVLIFVSGLTTLGMTSEVGGPAKEPETA